MTYYVRDRERRKIVDDNPLKAGEIFKEGDAMTDLLPASLRRRYDVQRVLGEGGFATVYAATDRRSGASVALKLLKKDGDSGYPPDVRRRFLREVRALEELESPHTVKMLAQGEADGWLYAVFEQLDGIELAQYVRERGRLDGPEVEVILTQLLEALDEAHRHGVLHRDIKPENIIVLRDDKHSVKLIDFGIARPMTDGSRGVTKTGELVGTPRYMSPEQLMNAPLTPASDLYSLGMVAYEMALGRDALQGGAWGDQLERLMSGHVFSVPELERVGARLHTVIARMAARRPDDRFASAGQVLRALSGEGPVVAEELRSKRKVMLAVIGLAVVVSAGAAWSLTRDHDPVEVRTNVVKQVTEIPRGAETTPTKPETKPERPTEIGRDSAGCFGEPVLDDLPFTPGMTVQLAGTDENGPVPLVLVLHDGWVSGSNMRANSGFADLADQAGFLVAFFHSEPPHAEEGTGPWTERAEVLNGARVPFVSKHLRRILNTRCVDEDRVYVVGHGHGGLGAEGLACHDLIIDGIATVSHLPKAPDDACDGRPPPKIPRIRFLPLDSAHHPVFGGTECDGTRAELTLNERDEQFAQEYGCVPNDPPFERGEDRRRRTWSCPTGVRFESRLVDGGHPWPGVKRSKPLRCDGPTPVGIDYAREIWNFFEGVPRLTGGCTHPTPFTGLHDEDKFAAYVPKTYTPQRPHPLVLLVHDQEVDGADFIETSGFIDIAEAEGALVLAPHGSDERTWEHDDHLEIERAYHSFSNSLCVDPTRVFVVGHGRGGTATELLDCADWITATAFVGSVRSLPGSGRAAHQLSTATECHGAIRRPSIQLWPTKAPCGDRSRSFSDSIEAWREHSGCDGRQEPAGLAGDPNNTCRSWPTCDAPFVACGHDGGLQWTGAEPRPRDDCKGDAPSLQMAPLLWDFFERAGAERDDD